ncbi:cyclase [Actinosynnema sp. ALI-1.44]|uniref:aromatase/cyclase n=1 Tax=Actinosynnema sp. ALI-1.44 TaxID=1933779 RepID=UPI00097BF78C|nr:aromatase/cyclase [Actinosynnema sp. ALI-1.44]ONI76383.1 cyclase [Actinosynnema sp. ALI-1.44]
MTAVSTRRFTTHKITVSAPADTVYGLVADVQRWPQVFPPTILVDHIDRADTHERIRIWATANATTKTWVSRRTLDPLGRVITFRQEVSSPPVASMGGTWFITETAAGQTTVTLEHDYTAIDDAPENVAWIDQAIDRNSHAELRALKTAAEKATHTVSFADKVTFEGSAEHIYDFLHRADQWPRRVPHVARVVLTEESPGLQTLEMDTRTADGATHTTKSIRVCLPHHLIAYKQLEPPALLTMHTGRWEIEGNTLTAQHTYTIKPEAVSTILGDQATMSDSAEFVRKALSGNSTATMRLACAYAAEKGNARLGGW